MAKIRGQINQCCSRKIEKKSCQLISTANPALFLLHLNFEIFALQFMLLIFWPIAGVNVSKTFIYNSLIWISILSLFRLEKNWNLARIVIIFWFFFEILSCFQPNSTQAIRSLGWQGNKLWLPLRFHQCTHIVRKWMMKKWASPNYTCQGCSDAKKAIKNTFFIWPLR